MDQEPEPQYGWTSNGSTLPMEIQYERGMQWYRFHPSSPWRPLDDDVFALYGWLRTETQESRIDRLEWKVRQLELELQRREDYENEMQERN
jgi:hypothetical protein